MAFCQPLVTKELILIKTTRADSLLCWKLRSKSNIKVFCRWQKTMREDIKEISGKGGVAQQELENDLIKKLINRTQAEQKLSSNSFNFLLIFYGSMALSTKDVTNLGAFEKEIIYKIYGPLQSYLNLMNNALHKLDPRTSFCGANKTDRAMRYVGVSTTEVLKRNDDLVNILEA